MIRVLEDAIAYIQTHPEPQSVREISYAERPRGPSGTDWSGMNIADMSVPHQKVGTITCGELAHLLAEELHRRQEVERLHREKWRRRLDALCEAKQAMQLINAGARDPHLRRIIEKMDDSILGIVQDIKEQDQ